MRSSVHDGSLILLIAIFSRSYIRFVAARASGEVPTGATWQRSFVETHPLYMRDSIVSAPIAYDLLREAAALGLGERVSSRLLGEEASRYVESTSTHIAASAASGGSIADSHVASGSITSTAAASRPPATGVRMRGKSFAEEVHEHASNFRLVKALVDRFVPRLALFYLSLPCNAL